MKEDPISFSWIEDPSETLIFRTIETLKILDAIDYSSQVTQIG